MADLAGRLYSVMKKALLIPIVGLLAAALSFFALGLKDVNTKANGFFSTAEIASDENWIKGAAPILAANFESVSIRNLNKDVEESFVFDVALSQIYEIETDYQEPPVDLRDLKLSGQLAASEKERSEIFCNLQDQKYCELVLVWDKNAPQKSQFVAVRLEDSLFGIIEAGLLADTLSVLQEQGRVNG